VQKRLILSGQNVYKGFVNKNDYPIITVALENQPIDVLVDTGFNGELMLPLSAIEKLNLKSVGDESYKTASGDVINTTFYFANLNWFNRNIKVGVLATTGENALLGMGLILPHSLLISPSEDRVEIF